MRTSFICLAIAVLMVCPNLSAQNVVPPSLKKNVGGGAAFPFGYQSGNAHNIPAITAPPARTVRSVTSGVSRRVPGQYATIQAAIYASNDGDTVLVSEGTYKENIRYYGKAIIVASLYLTDGDTSHISKTIIDGSTPTNPDSGSVVSFVDGEDTASVLCAFTIQGGTGTRWHNSVDGNWYRTGGGVFCQASGARLTRNIITRNHVVDNNGGGGGIHAMAYPNAISNMILEGNYIGGNYAKCNSSQNWGFGGGASLWGIKARIVGNVFERDTVESVGGAQGAGLNLGGYNSPWPDEYVAGNVFRSNVLKASLFGAVGAGVCLASSGAVTIQNNLFQGNAATSLATNGWAGGGGLLIDDHYTPGNFGRKTIVNNKFVDNTIDCIAQNEGGGIYLWYTTATISGNYFAGNVLKRMNNYGGPGISIGYSSFRLENNIFAQNTSACYAGAVLIYQPPYVGSEQAIVNNTFAQNFAAALGGGMSICWTANVVCLNNICWGDSAVLGSSEVQTYNATPIVEYCDIKGGYTGVTNISADPLFTPGDTLFHLASTSPCIGRACDSIQIGGTWYHAPTIDFDGNPRPQPPGSIPDMGAEESPIGPIPSLSTSRLNVDFGTLFTGFSSGNVILMIKNIASHNVIIDSIRVSGQDFFLANVPALPDTLFPSDSISIAISFSPHDRGLFVGGVIVIPHDQLDLRLTIPLQGSGVMCGPQFQQLVKRVTNAAYMDRTAIVDSFWTANPTMPLVEQDSVCEFMYRGTANTINVPGDANSWVTDASPMQKLSSTNLWYRTDVFFDDARLEYKFYIDGATWILDPRNPRQAVGGYGPNSEVRMPAYAQPPELLYYADIPHGMLHDTTFSSTTLGNSRTISVYLPPGYSNADSFAVVLFHDGLEFISLAFANRALDHMIAHNLIQPLIGVFVPPVNRDDEYVGTSQAKFASFIANELMPYIDATYRTMRNPARRATVGISNGGNIALLIAFGYPTQFGMAGSYSGAILSSTSSAFQNGPVRLSKIYVDVGTYDLTGLYDISYSFNKILDAKVYDHRYFEWHEGHSWMNWGAHLDNAFEYFFPGRAVGVQEKEGLPRSFALLQNYPNPFNPSTTIRFDVPQRSRVRLTIYNILGQQVAEVANEEMVAGSYERIWNPTVASGMYFYRIEAVSVTDPGKRFVEVKKLLLLR